MRVAGLLQGLRGFKGFPQKAQGLGFVGLEVSRAFRVEALLWGVGRVRKLRAQAPEPRSIPNPPFWGFEGLRVQGLGGELRVSKFNL